MSEPRVSMLREYVQDVVDFPSPGIVFKDITPLLAEPKAFTTCLDLLAERWAGERIDAVVGIESRGFIFGAALAARMMASFVPARKPGKLPRAVVAAQYQLEYGDDALEMHTDALRAGARVVIIDDVLATGGTASAAVTLVRGQGAELVGCGFVVELSFLNGRDKLGDVSVHSLVKY